MVVNLVLEFEYVGGVDVEFVNCFCVGGKCGEVFCYVFVVVCGCQELVVCVVGVGYGFLGSESFGCYQEQSCFWIYVFQYFGDMGVIDVRDKVYVEVVFIWMQCFGYYERIEVGVVDIDVNYVGDWFVGVVFLVIGDNCFGEGFYFFQYSVYFWYYIFVINYNWCIVVVMQCDVQYCVVFGVVDFFI